MIAATLVVIAGHGTQQEEKKEDVKIKGKKDHGEQMEENEHGKQKEEKENCEQKDVQKEKEEVKARVTGKKSAKKN